MIQAISGLTDIQAGNSSRPKMVRTVIPDKVTALKAAQAITAALFYRSKRKKGVILNYQCSMLWLLFYGQRE